jgi:sugar fermentation stimulation protein
MQYAQIKKAIFQERPNRFIARVKLDGELITCHVKNTGRCRELLLPGVTVYCAYSPNPDRKTHYDLVAVEKRLPGQKKPLLINMDSQAPNQVVQEWLEAGGLFPDLCSLKPECKYGDSRFDFYGETPRQKFFLEVKGVTLERDGVVLFPDAPTERGVKHLTELARCLKDGYAAYLLFLVQLEPALYFTPNEETHPAFGAALRQAKQAGVHILAYTCTVTPSSLVLHQPLPLKL